MHSFCILITLIYIFRSKDILYAYTTCYEYFKGRVFKPKIIWMDDEAYNYLDKYNWNQEMESQLVPQEEHRINAAESAIETWKTTPFQDYVAQILNTPCNHFLPTETMHINIKYNESIQTKTTSFFLHST